jgi:hypothetical protein
VRSGWAAEQGEYETNNTSVFDFGDRLHVPRRWMRNSARGCNGTCAHSDRPGLRNRNAAAAAPGGDGPCSQHFDGVGAGLLVIHESPLGLDSGALGVETSADGALGTRSLGPFDTRLGVDTWPLGIMTSALGSRPRCGTAAQTLNLKRITSPSCTTYSLPSIR